MRKEDLETYQFVTNNKKLFDEIQDKYDNAIDVTHKRYTILNYRRILNDLCDYIEGYIEYKDSDSDKYGNKVLASTAKFYDSIFYDKRYRTIITLPDMPSITEDYLEGTKDLQELMLRVDSDTDELHAMILMTNNMYRKLSKVFKDDLEIWMWLAKIKNHDASSELRQKFKDKSTPVMHEK